MNNSEQKKLAGKKGGSKTSEAKRVSSRLNGQRGGRPRDGMRPLRKFIRKNRLDLRNASDDDLKVIWSALLNIDNNYMFWVGDTLNEIALRHGLDSAKAAIKKSPDPKRFGEAMAISTMFSTEEQSTRRISGLIRGYLENNAATS